MYETFAKHESHWWFQGREKILRTLLNELLNKKSALKILDVGCGTGVLLPLLLEYGEVDGLDPSPIAIEYCRKKNLKNVTLINGNFPEGIPKNKKYDLITLMDVIEHTDDDTQMLLNAYSFLSPGGLMLCSAPAYGFLWGPHDILNLHKRRYTINSLTDRVQKARFSIKKASYFNTLLLPPILLVKLFRKFKIGPEETVPDTKIMTNNFINKLLTSVFATERFLLKKFNLPFGVSILVVGEKK